MKKILFVSGITLLCIVLNAQTPYYYYYNGERQYLSLNTEYAFLSVKGELPADVKLRGVKATVLQSNKNQHQEKGITSHFCMELQFNEKLSDKQYLGLLADIKRKNKEVIVSPYFKVKENGKIGLSNFFYVSLKEEGDSALLRQMAERTECLIVRRDIYMPLWFILCTTEASELNAMECANLFYESGLFQYAEPDLMGVFSSASVNDPCFGDQWGLKNTGQYGGTTGIDIKVYEAWEISTGSDVIVAVIDDGAERNHLDLLANMLPDSLHRDIRLDNFGTIYESSPSVVYTEHGTACAGIIGAARNNDEGIAGIAPDCKLMDISIAPGQYPLLAQMYAHGINWAWQKGADVINCSWGIDIQYGHYITTPIDNAVTQGRGGKGCVVVAASHNQDVNSVSFPASLDNVIAVGAISPCGERKSKTPSCDTETSWGSNYGEKLDIMAPGVLISTTDRQGSGNGYNYDYYTYIPVHETHGGTILTSDYSDYNYTAMFWGTSSACPHVAGVAALILSVNPNLTGQQVRDIIESTAQKVGGYNYQITSGRPNGTWHEEMGYGLVDASAAVTCAMPVNFTNQTVTTNTTVEGCEVIVKDVTVTNNATLILEGERSVKISGPFKAESGTELKMRTK